LTTAFILFGSLSIIELMGVWAMDVPSSLALAASFSGFNVFWGKRTGQGIERVGFA